MARRYDLQQHADEALEAAATALSRGELVVYPTETFYGLGAALDPVALQRLVSLKGREPDKPLPVIADGPEAVLQRFTVPPELMRLTDLWPGPLTLGLVPRREVPAALLAKDGTVGVRVSSLPLARAVAKAAGGCVTSTSANLSGAPPVAEVSALEPRLVSGVALVLDAGLTPGGRASTLVVAREGRAFVVRQGAVSIEALAERLGYEPGHVPGT